MKDFRISLIVRAYDKNQARNFAEKLSEFSTYGIPCSIEKVGQTRGYHRYKKWIIKSTLLENQYINKNQDGHWTLSELPFHFLKRKDAIQIRNIIYTYKKSEFEILGINL
jgi:hypothetical protein